MRKKINALINLFTMSYHFKYNYKIYNDLLASKLITQEEYNQISNDMIKSIKYINPNYCGTDKDKLRYVVDNYLSPFLLGRKKYNMNMLSNEIKLGCKQYIIMNTGYDTSGYKVNNNVIVFELDNDEIIKDKIIRIKKNKINNLNINYIPCSLNNCIDKLKSSSFDTNKKTYCSLLGISYYLSKNEFEDLISNISKILSDGSTIIFDYPTYDYNNSINDLLLSNKNNTKYSIKDIENILDKNNLLMCENLNDKVITNKYYYDYNTLNPEHKILAPANINICFTIKKTLHNN